MRQTRLEPNMLRFGKGLTRTLNAAAKLYATHGRGTEFLCETCTQQTRLQKAVRQIQRKSPPNPTTLEAIKAAKAMREQREKQETNWAVLRRATKPISDESMKVYCEKRWPHIYKVDDKND